MKFQDYELEASVYTLTVYENEFDGANMLNDLFSGIPETMFDDNELNIGIKDLILATNVQVAMKCVWAMARTANESVPSYVKWSKSIKGVNTIDCFMEIVPEIMDAFFRSED